MVWSLGKALVENMLKDAIWRRLEPCKQMPRERSQHRGQSQLWEPQPFRKARTEKLMHETRNGWQIKERGTNR
jgi:hypothetical protein